MRPQARSCRRRSLHRAIKQKNSKADLAALSFSDTECFFFEACAEGDGASDSSLDLGADVLFGVTHVLPMSNRNGSLAKNAGLVTLS